MPNLQKNLSRQTGWENSVADVKPGAARTGGQGNSGTPAPAPENAGKKSEAPVAMPEFKWHADDVRTALDRIEEEVKEYIRYDYRSHTPQQQEKALEKRRAEIAIIRDFFSDIADRIQENGLGILNPYGSEKYYGTWLYLNLHKMLERIRTGSKRNPDAIVDVFRFVAQACTEERKKSA